MESKTVVEACTEFLKILRREHVMIGMQELQREIRHALVIDALKQHKGNQKRTARAIKVHRNTLSRYIDDIMADGGPDPIRLTKPKQSRAARAHRTEAA